MLGRNIGIDLGTTSVIVYLEGKGIIMSEPSVVAYRKTTGKIMAVGRKAYDMVGKESRSVEVIRPMRDGVVSDFSVTEQMLRYFIRIICKNEIFKPNIIVSMPGTVTNLERTPPELAGDIMEEGIILTGGTAQLLGLDKVIEEATHIHTRIADDPVNCVARGIGAVLGDLDILVNNGYLFMSRQDISGVTNEKEDYYDV